MDRRDEIRFSLSLLLVPAALLIMGEMVARLYFEDSRREGFDWRGLEETTSADNSIPYRFTPNSAFQHLQFNNLGLRGPDLALPKPSGTTRLAILGDSSMFNAVLVEEETFAAQLTSALEARHPRCDFDYTNASGPAYSTRFLSWHWSQLVDQVQPDLSIIMAGSPYDVLSFGETEIQTPRATGLARVWSRSGLKRLYERVVRRLSLTRAFGPGLEDMDGFDDAFDRRLHQVTSDLITLAPPNAALLIGHRGRIREAANPSELPDQTRHLRNSTDIKAPAAALRLTERSLDTMRDAALANGWLYADAMLALPPDDTHFRDALHLTEQGAKRLAETVAPLLDPLVETCAVGGTD